MIHTRLSLRRPLAGVGTTLAGLATVLVLSAPAVATGPTPSGTPGTAEPTASHTPTATPSGTSSAASPTAPVPPTVPAGKPVIRYWSTCDKLVFEVTNPKEAPGAIDLSFVPSSGGGVGPIYLQPGESKVVEFRGVDGLTVVPVIDDDEHPQLSATWEKPANCGTGGGDLPLTGAATGGIAAAAGALLVGGGALYLLARRRRIRFTA